MIRFRENHTGHEAEWDRYEWSGDEAFVERLRTLERILHVHSTFASDTFEGVQARMAEEFPQAGITVVRQTPSPDTRRMCRVPE